MEIEDLDTILECTDAHTSKITSMLFVHSEDVADSMQLVSSTCTALKVLNVAEYGKVLIECLFGKVHGQS
mgnify:CR=1 FL=1